MQVKLTLKLDKDALEKAKRYSREYSLSLSKMVENYFKNLGKLEKKALSPIVAELSGIITEKDVKALCLRRNSRHVCRKQASRFKITGFLPSQE